MRWWVPSDVLDQVPFPLGVTPAGPEHVVELLDPAARELLGRPIREALPEIKDSLGKVSRILGLEVPEPNRWSRRVRRLRALARGASAGWASDPKSEGPAPTPSDCPLPPLDRVPRAYNPGTLDHDAPRGRHDEVVDVGGAR